MSSTDAAPEEALPLEELIARAIEKARDLRDRTDPRDRRELEEVVTKLEEAGLWICQHRAREHLGDLALLDWLRGI